MGEAIATSSFGPADYAAFRERLHDELAVLEGLIGQPGFGAGEPTIGAEVELALVDAGMRPARVNEELLARLGEHAGPDEVAPELDRFCIELDTPPAPLAGTPFAGMEDAIRTGMVRIEAAAEQIGCRAVPIGTLATVRVDDLAPDLAMTPEPRYAALAAGLERHRSDSRIEIVGEERLETEVPGIAAEGIMAALQVHLKVAPDRFAATMNAAHLVSAPVLGAAANSPYVLGRSLWAETRIPLLRQVVDGAAPPDGHPSRAGLGHGWLRSGPLELFAEDVGMHPPLLPVRFDEAAAGSPHGTPQLPALRLHEGTIWRWNRPVFDGTGDGHVRIELRTLPSGPTVVDMVANAALLVGSTLALAENRDLTAVMPFAAARANLDAAARDGLDATILWPAAEAPSPVPRPLADVALELIPAASDALRRAGVEGGEVDRRLDVVRRRVELRRTGAEWQRETVAAREERAGRDAAIVEMVRELGARAAEDVPVAEWPVEGAR